MQDAVRYRMQALRTASGGREWPEQRKNLISTRISGSYEVPKINFRTKGARILVGGKPRKFCASFSVVRQCCRVLDAMGHFEKVLGNAYATREFLKERQS